MLFVAKTIHFLIYVLSFACVLGAQAAMINSGNSVDLCVDAATFLIPEQFSGTVLH